jgi:hypothetical protein
MLMTRRQLSTVAQLVLCGAAAASIVGFGPSLGVTAISSGGKLPASAPEPPAHSLMRLEFLRAEGGTYLARMLVDRDSIVARWPVRIERPIRVWIEPSPREGFSRWVQDAFAGWTAAGLPLRFVFISRAADAEIRVHWTSRLDRKTGNTVWRVDDTGWMVGADVVLATHFADGKPLDGRSLRAIALHEVGHVIGLGHSDEGHDVMAPLVSVSSLSAADRATARLLYGLLPGHIH